MLVVAGNLKKISSKIYLIILKIFFGVSSDYLSTISDNLNNKEKLDIEDNGNGSQIIILKDKKITMGSDLVHSIFLLQGFLDSIAASVILYAFLIFGGVADYKGSVEEYKTQKPHSITTQGIDFETAQGFDTYTAQGFDSDMTKRLDTYTARGFDSDMTKDGPGSDTMKGGDSDTKHLYGWVSQVAFFLIFSSFLDNFLQARIISYSIPVRSMPRYVLDLASVSFFGLSFIVFSKTNSLSSISGWLFLISGCVFRMFWAMKTNVEAYTWRVIGKAKKQAFNQSINEKHSEPTITRGVIWELFHFRIKIIGVFSFFYAVIFFLVIAIIKYDINELTPNVPSKYLLGFYFLLFLIVEGVRFCLDFLAVGRSGSNYKVIKAENYVSIMKTILWMPPFVKIFLSWLSDKFFKKGKTTK